MIYLVFKRENRHVGGDLGAKIENTQASDGKKRFVCKY